MVVSRRVFIGLATLALLLPTGCMAPAEHGPREVTPAQVKSADPATDPNAATRPPRNIATH
jgi:hypothetical protein